MLLAHRPVRVLLLFALAGALGCGELLEVPAGPSEVRLKVGEEIVLDGSGSFDPEGEKLTCRWRQVAGPGVELKGADTPWPSFIPTGPGRYEFELVVARPKGGKGSEPAVVESPPARIAVDVLPPNRPPRVELEREVRAEPGQWAVLDGGRATDPDGDTLSFRWELVREAGRKADGGGGEPPWLTVEMDPFDGRARRVRVRGWKEGAYRFRLTVTDALGARSRAETILRVARRGLVPVAIPRMKGPRGAAHFPMRLDAWPHPSGGVDLPPRAAAAASRDDDTGAYTLDGTGSTDPNGDELEYRWMQVEGPIVRTLKPDRELGLARLTLTPPSPGHYRFRLVVSDGRLDGEPVYVDIDIPGARPALAGDPGRVSPAPAHVRGPRDATLIADAGEDVVAEAGTEIALGGTVRGAPRGAEPLYEWRQVSGPRVKAFRLPSFEGRARPRFTPEVPDRYEFELRVSTDGLAWSAPDRAMVTVLAANRPPWIAAPGEIAARAGEIVRIAAAAGDLDGDAVSLAWRQLSGERAELGPAEDGIELAAPDGVGLVLLEAIVRDSRGAESRAKVAVRVRGTGGAPVAVARAPLSARPGRLIVLDGSESYDTEGRELRWLWDAPGKMLIGIRGADRPRASFRPPSPGSYRFALVVSAGGRESSPAYVTVEVEEPGSEGGRLIVAPVAPRLTAGRPVILDASRSRTERFGGPGGRTGRLRPRILWRQLAGPPVEFDRERARTVVRPTETGRYAFEATSPDLGEKPRAERVVVRFEVARSNLPPVASARARVTSSGRVVLDASGSRDPEGAPLLYRWKWGHLAGPEEQVASMSHPAGAGHPTRDPRKVSPFAPTRRKRLALEGVRPGRYRVRLVVSDGERVSRSEIVEFEVPEYRGQGQ